MNSSIAIFGANGYVGTAAFLLFRRTGADMHMIDPTYTDDYKNANKKLPKNIRMYGKITRFGYDLAVICVPTEMKENGECDTRTVEGIVSKVRADVILIKSTVPPGTVDKLKKRYGKRIVFSPEYVGQSSYDNSYEFHTNMAKTPWIVLGGAKRDTKYIYDMLLPIVGCEKKWHFLTAKEAELVKYMENILFATKVTLSNEFYEICKKLGCNWEKVRQAWLDDPRINPMHTAVFKDSRGFGGKCFPKDTNALVYACKKAGYNPELIQEVLRSNVRFTKDKTLKKVND